MRNIRKTANIPNKKAGFTVLETMIAIMVASLAIAGATMAARGGIRAGSIAKEEVRAFYMAQEILEILNNNRDSNELYNVVQGTNRNWLYGVASVSSDPCWFGNKCYVDPWETDPMDPTKPFVFHRCSGSCPKVSYKNKPGDYRYGYPLGLGFADASYIKETQYTKEIILEQIDPNQVLVTLNITWDHAGSPQSFKTKTLLTNWYTSSTSE